MRPEDELLVRVARAAVHEEGEIPRIAVEDLDWFYVIEAANRHKLMPHLYRYLSSSPHEAIPSGVLDRLSHEYRANARRNVAYTTVLLQILELLDRRGIPAIPYKGPVLGLFLYGNTGLRQFDDLDIVVRETDVQRARQLLMDRGYRPLLSLTSAQEEALLRRNCEVVLVDDGWRTVLDLHWRLVPRYFSFPLPTEALWDHLEWVPVGGADVQTLSAELLLVTLCAHGTKHFWDHLGLVCDVAKLTERPGLDWKEAMSLATSFGGRRMLLLGVSLATELLDAEPPRDVRHEFSAEPFVASLTRQVRSSLFDGGAAPWLASGLFHVRAKERIRDKLRYVVELAVLPRTDDWTAVPALPARLGILYYIVRPVRLIWKHLLSRILGGNPSQDAL